MTNEENTTRSEGQAAQTGEETSRAKTSRRPFVAPRLRREAALIDRTGGEINWLSQGS
jgi:hypothetical protein